MGEDLKKTQRLDYADRKQNTHHPFPEGSKDDNKYGSSKELGSV